MPSLLNALQGPPRDAERNAALALILGVLSVGAWGGLWLWGTSPYARYVAHGGWLDSAAFAQLCRAVPAGTLLVPAALHALAWVLMIAAMMLPTTYPVLGVFRMIARGRPHAGGLVGLVVAGFFIAWFGFGLLAHGLDAGLTWLGGRSDWLVTHGWVAGVGLLAGAGLFQFSALKYRCLEQCHTPYAFVASRWHGRSPAREAFRIGLDHGVFCVGCCWALMLCMFAVGTGSLGWMLALGALMAVEKSAPGGSLLRWPIGLLLLGAAGAVLLAHL